MFSYPPSFLGVDCGFSTSSSSLFASSSKEMKTKTKTKTKHKKKIKKKMKKKKIRISTIYGKDVEDVEEEKTKRKVLPGEVTLDRESWVHEMKDTIVEYNDGLTGQRQLGLVQRPTGKRFWAIIDEKGVEREVNIYQISFQWPTQQPQLPPPLSSSTPSQTKNEIQRQEQPKKHHSQSWGMSPTELYKYREYALELLRQQQVDVRTVWRHFLKKNEERLIGYIVAKFIFHTSMYVSMFLCGILYLIGF
jgi:hypothetical protein